MYANLDLNSRNTQHAQSIEKSLIFMIFYIANPLTLKKGAFFFQNIRDFSQVGPPPRRGPKMINLKSLIKPWT